jgi:hypothetical protein
MPASAIPPSAAFCTFGDEPVRCRSVSGVVLTGTVDLKPLPARLLADWENETRDNLELEVGDVEVMPLARARSRWPDFRLCVAEAGRWLESQGVSAGLLGDSNRALMVCRGARYHHDGEQYAGAAFFNLFVSDDVGLDLHFASTGHRIPLVRGTAVVFDTCQPHGVIQRSSAGFDASEFVPEIDWKQYFLTWELPIEDAALAQALHIELDLVHRSIQGSSAAI